MVAAVVTAVPAVLPYLGAIITSCEHLFAHKPGSGPQKKQAALAMAQAGLGVLTGLESTPGTPLAGSSLAADLGKLIDDTVQVLNDMGALHHQVPAKVVK